MPVCNECRKFSDCQEVDFCEYCGAKDWKAESGLGRVWRVAKKDSANFFARQKTSEEEFLKSIANFIGVVLWAVVVIGVVLGGLWLLIAIIKFMWEHS